MIERSFSDSTGFSTAQPGPALNESVAVVANPVAGGDFSNIFDQASRLDEQSKRFIQRVNNAYLLDGFVHNAIDRHAEIFKDFDLAGGKKPVAYVKKRLARMSLQGGEHWKTTIARYAHEYCKHGHPMLVKKRLGDGSSDVVRPLYADRPYPLAAVFLLSPERVEPAYQNKAFAGWRIKGMKKETLRLMEGTRMPADGALISNRFPTLERDALLIPSVDVVNTAYKRPSDGHYGIGLAVPALEDVALLRNIEQTTAVMTRKNSMPLLWHRILKATSAQSGVQSEINAAARLHQSVSPDGVIVTPMHHELKVLGSESQALRLEGYLKYFSSRAFAGMGVSPFLMGFEGGSLGAVEAAMELLMTRIRFMQEELARDLEMFLLWELLYEGGFDPFEDEEDQVRLVFREVDESRMIKLRSHFADLYTKNAITFQEMREGMGYSEKVSEASLYLRRVAIPLEEAKAEAKASAAPPPQPEPAAQPDPQPAPKKARVRELALEAAPRDPSEVDDFLEALRLGLGLDLSPHRMEFERLAGDSEAVSLFAETLTPDQEAPNDPQSAIF